MILTDSALKKKRILHEAESEKMTQRMEMLQKETEDEETVFRKMIENKQKADGELRALRWLLTNQGPAFHLLTNQGGGGWDASEAGGGQEGSGRDNGGRQWQRSVNKMWNNF